MNVLPKFALAFQGIPATKAEDYINCYGSYTRWSEDGKRLLEYNWGSGSTIYIAHQFSMVPEYSENMENPEESGKPTGKMKEAVQAMAITVPNPVTREKLFQQAIHDIYRVNGYDEQLAFAQKMLNGSIDNPGSEEMQTYKEVSSWVNFELDKWEGLTVDNARAHVISELDAYDSSDNVNSFYLVYNGMKLQWWVDRDTRVSLRSTTQIVREAQEAQKVAVPRTTIWYNTIALDLPCDAVLAMLAQLELYSLTCYSKTEEHRSAIQALDSVEEILNYDYTTGYPEKLIFDLEQLG